MSDFKPDKYWKGITKDQNAEIDLALAMFAIYAPLHENISVSRYVTHLSKISQSVSERFDLLINEGAQDDARTRLAALKYILSEQEEYSTYGDSVPEILESHDLFRCIDQRKGCAGMLALLYMRTALSLGWHMEVLSMPDLYICRLIMGGEHILFDPSDVCSILEAHDLRTKLKAIIGKNAELSASYYEALTSRDFIIKLLNPVKNRFIEDGDYKMALSLVDKMRELMPQEYRLLFDSGVLNARIGNNDKAITDLEEYISLAPNMHDRGDALALLHELKQGLGQQ